MLSFSPLFPECSRELREGAAAISSLCWINAIILYQRSLGITFYAKCFQAYFFLNDVPNLLAHFKLLMSFIFKPLLRVITISTGWDLIASAGPQERSRYRNAIKYWSSTKYLPWHLLGAAAVIGTGTAAVVTEDAQCVSHGNCLAESNKSIRVDESCTQEVGAVAGGSCWWIWDLPKTGVSRIEIDVCISRVFFLFSFFLIKNK